MNSIAVVDDEPDIAEVLKRGLEQNGFSVEAFTDPESALRKFRPGAYDMMIIDIRMPKLNGFDLYRELRKKDGKIKVVFLTAFEIYYDEFRKMFPDRKSTRLNSSHEWISYAVFCLKKKKKNITKNNTMYNEKYV